MLGLHRRWAWALSLTKSERSSHGTAGGRQTLPKSGLDIAQCCLEPQALPWAAVHPEGFPPRRNHLPGGSALRLPQKQAHLGAGGRFLTQLCGREKNHHFLRHKEGRKPPSSTLGETHWIFFFFFKEIESCTSFSINVGLVSES